MRCIIFILCLAQYQVQASGSDWLSRTVRLDFIVDPEALHAEYDFPEPERPPAITTGGTNVTNGQFPWTIQTFSRSPIGTGVHCTGTIISDSFFLSDIFCAGQGISNPPPNSMLIHVGPQLSWPLPPATSLVRHIWYIAPSALNSPNIALCRIHEPLTFNPNVQPIRLPYTANVNFSYEAWSSLILGYRSSALNQQLLSVPNKILHNSQCYFSSSIDDHEMCGLTDIDPYDNQWSPVRISGFAGGAWMVYEYASDLNFHPVLIGIHHYQFYNQTDATYGRATRVSHFLEWIEALSGELLK